MKIVQTFWTAGQDPLKYAFGWTHQFLSLISIVLLCFSQPIFSQTQVRLRRAGTLSKVLTRAQQDTCMYLVVSGPVNSADLRLLRRMGGYADGEGKPGRLKSLDLRNAKLRRDRNPFMVLDAEKECLAGVMQPSFTIYKEYAIGYDRLLEKPNISGANVVWKHKPIYYLAHNPDSSLLVSYTPPHRETHGVKQLAIMSGEFCNGPIQEYSSVWEFDWIDGMDFKTWKRLKRERLHRVKGHKITRKGDTYFLEVSSQKNAFSPITFYKCPQLRVVALSEKVGFYPDFYDEQNQIRYYIGDALFLWVRPEIAPYVQKKIRRQSGLQNYKTYEHSSGS